MPVEGFRFQCVPGCSNCCEQKGNVYVTEGDIERAARFLGLPREAFEARYVYRTRHQIRLRKPPKSACFFLADKRCTIHPVKPVQCRLFPFWPELVEHPAQWTAASGYCPGMGQGELVQIGSAVETAHQMRAAYPALYRQPGSGKISPED